MNKKRSLIGPDSVDILDAIPFFASVTILCLYFLAFFRALTPLLPILFLFLCIWHVRKKLADPQFLLAVGLMILAAVLASGRVVTWWDDLNFWANDAKFLWYMKGFAGKYGNVSPEFGDYPPVTALWKWIFLSFSPRIYREGLQYSAYHVLNMIYLLPLLKSTRRFPSLGVRLLAVPAVFLIPGIVCALQFEGSAADITMGAIYGTLLLTMSEQPERSVPNDQVYAAGIFRLSRIAVHTSVLLLTKNTGFEWAFFALLFWLFVCRKKETTRTILITVFIPCLFWGSWLLFCLVNRRVAKLTGEGLRMARGGFVMPERAGEKFRVFLQSFLLYPLHEDKQWSIDLSAGALLLIILITSVIIYVIDRRRSDREHALTVYSGRQCFFLILSGLAAYGAIMVTHLSIFQVEDQYFDPFSMTRSISRYAAPYTIATIMLLLHEIADDALLPDHRPDSPKDRAGRQLLRHPVLLTSLPVLLFPLLTACYTGETRAFLTWRTNKAHDLAVREETIGEDGLAFLNWTADHQDLCGRGRVLFLRDSGTNHWVKDTYISYAACPTAVIYAEAAPDEAERLREELHAAIVYDGALTSADGENSSSGSAE